MCMPALPLTNLILQLAYLVDSMTIRKTSLVMQEQLYACSFLCLGGLASGSRPLLQPRQRYHQQKCLHHPLQTTSHALAIIGYHLSALSTFVLKGLLDCQLWPPKHSAVVLFACTAGASEHIKCLWHSVSAPCVGLLATGCFGLHVEPYGKLAWEALAVRE